MITFVSYRKEEETGNAGGQPASNILYGYTAKGEGFGLLFSFFCRLPIWLRKPKVEFTT